MSEKYKVAIASSDGVTVDSHFGHVNNFLVFEVDESTGQFNQLEETDVNQACSGGACGEMDAVASALSASGVNYVLCARIGPHAIQALAKKNISAYDIVLPIEEAISKINIFRLKIKKSGPIRQC